MNIVMSNERFVLRIGVICYHKIRSRSIRKLCVVNVVDVQSRDSFMGQLCPRGTNRGFFIKSYIPNMKA